MTDRHVKAIHKKKIGLNLFFVLRNVNYCCSAIFVNLNVLASAVFMEEHLFSCTKHCPCFSLELSCWSAVPAEPPVVLGVSQHFLCVSS